MKSFDATDEVANDSVAFLMEDHLKKFPTTIAK
jgi:hypothetical protein